MDGQADSAPTIDDIASLVFDTPDEGTEDADAKNDTGETDESQADPADDPGENPDADEDEPDETEDEADEADPKAKADKPADLIEVPGKDADGNDTVEKVTLAELKNGYLRHSDYTRKTQELGAQRTEAMRIVETKISESRDHYLTEAQVAHQAIVELAQLRSAQEMAELAARDPQLAMQEDLRQKAVVAKLDEIRQKVLGHKQTMTQEQEASEQRQAKEARDTLLADGFDLKVVPDLFEGIHKAFGVPRERLQKVVDPALVKIFDAAMKWQKANSKAGEKVKPAAVADKTPALVKPPARLPAPRQSAPIQSKTEKVLNARFTGGRAGTKDLASWLMSKNL
jgi:hypothetical protein